MLNKLQYKRDQKGFTLIELMIVIAIIGILAAIAIPQFAAYRMRSFNASGQSDVRNLATSQAAFFADWQIFGQSTAGIVQAVAPVWVPNAGGPGAILVGPYGDGVTTHFPAIDATTNGGVGTDQGLQIPLGNNVYLISSTNAAGAGLLANTSFTSTTKHMSGNMYFGSDGDITAVYFAQVPGSEGSALVAADCPASTSGADDFTGGTVQGQNWMVR